MNYEIKLQFYRNSRNARKLKRIVEDMRLCHISDELDEPCHIILDKQSTIDDFKRLVYFWRIIRKYNDTVIFADGRMLTKEQSEDLLGWIRCYCNHQYFPDQQDYCCISPGLKHLHGWGCKWLYSVMRHGRFGRLIGVHWYTVGPFDGKVQFIDKQDIKDKLKAEAKTRCLHLCPLFSLKKAFHYVDQLPDQIDPRVDSEWEYESSPEPESRDEVIGVRPKMEDISLFL